MSKASAHAEPPPQQRPKLLGAFPQLFVADVEASSRFFVETLGFTLSYQYGQPPFYALVERDGARLNLRFVHQPVILRDAGTDRDAELDLLSASIPVSDIDSLYAEYKAVAAPLHQTLRKQPWGLRDFIVRDPDGNLIHFSEWLPPGLSPARSFASAMSVLFCTYCATRDFSVGSASMGGLDLRYLPRITVCRKDSGGHASTECKTTTDLGMAAIDGKFDHVGKVKGPILRSLASRAPYFHNGSAQTLLEAVRFYERRFGVAFTAQEESDLVAFLNAL